MSSNTENAQIQESPADSVRFLSRIFLLVSAVGLMASQLILEAGEEITSLRLTIIASSMFVSSVLMAGAGAIIRAIEEAAEK